MQNRNFFIPVILTICATLSLCACKKGDAALIKTALSQPYRNVAEYQAVIGGNNPASSYPVLFKNTYDPSGKTVKEIACNFYDGFPGFVGNEPQDFLDFIVVRNGSSLFLLNKSNTGDTAMQVSFNSQGRPEASITYPVGGIDDNYSTALETENFTYVNDRIFSVTTDGTKTDTVGYDSVGNVLSFAGNVYLYDYYRKATQTFYINDLEDRDHAYYLLQYLGYFPEVTSTVNIRINFTDARASVNLDYEQFDADGRVINFSAAYLPGYNNGYNGRGGAVITWNTP
jgi:hypothetical protein